MTPRINATRAVASTFGVIAGLAGIEHDIGEMLQGNRPPDGMVIESWPESPALRILGGEPAMTVVPNLLVTGVLATIVSLVLFLWAARFVQRKRGGLVLIFLSVIQLLVGGGFGPPLVGIIAGGAGTRIGTPPGWGRAHPSANTRRFLARLWPWSFAASLAAWLSVLPGLLILGIFVPSMSPALVATLPLLAFGLLLVTIVLGFVHDTQRQADLRRAHPISG